MKEYDVIVVGSGIAGMTAAIYLKRANINVLVIESSAPGGQMLKSSIIENYPGYTSGDGATLSYNIFKQVSDLKVDYVYDELISSDFDKNIVYTTKDKFKYKYLIIATGRREKTLNIENEKSLLGKGLSYCAVCDGNFYKDKAVAVIGSGNSAVEEALYLARICKKVYIVIRSDRLKAENRSIDLIDSFDNIEVINNNEVKEFILDDDKLKSIVLTDNKTIDVSGIFVSIGRIPNSEIFRVDKKNNYILVDKNCKTSKDNVYACGDVIYKDVYQLTTASSEGTIASSDIIKKLNQN